MSSRTCQSAWLYLTERHSAVPAPGISGRLSRFSAIRLSTEFTSPEARLQPALPQSLTPSFTAAEGGTLSMNSSCAADMRRMSSTTGSSRLVGVFDQTSR